MEIRVAEDEDLPAVTTLLRTRGWDEEFDADLGDVYIAWDEEIIGCLQLVEIDDDTAVLDLVLVDEARRRQGIGTALITAAMYDATSSVYVSCREDAVPFYKSLGFASLDAGIASAPTSVKDYWRQVGNRAPIAMVKM